MSMYGVIHPDYHYQRHRCFGENHKEIIVKTLYKLESIDASKVISFDCGTYMTMFVFRSIEKVPSLIPGRETSSGITHAYKAGDTWKFMAQEDYESQKDQL